MSSRSRDRVVVTSPAILISCLNPVLTIGFPPTFPGFNTVTLANGAVVDLCLLGGVISQFCPSLACPSPFVLGTTAPLLDP